MITMLIAAAIVFPADRSYATASTSLQRKEIVECSLAIGDMGQATAVDTEYGQRLDFRYKNLGGTMKEPSFSLEVHDGEQRTLLLYGFGPMRGAVKNIWKHFAKKCFPEVADVTVVRPAK